MSKIWSKTYQRHKLSASQLFSLGDQESLQGCLMEICRELDYPCPVVLNKHQKDWDSFSLVRFLPSDFIESVDFDLLELERCKDDEKAGH